MISAFFQLRLPAIDLVRRAALGALLALGCSSESGEEGAPSAGRGGAAGAEAQPVAGRGDGGRSGAAGASAVGQGGGTNGGSGGSIAGASGLSAGASGSAGAGVAGAGAGGSSGAMSSGGAGAGSGSGGSATLAGAGGALGGAGTAGSAGSGPLGPLTVYIAGDSTVQTYKDTASKTDQAGWGQMLGPLFDDAVTVDNRAIGGRTARRFIDEGRLDDILKAIDAGDYLLVQFGTNDGNRTATYELNGATIPYYLDPATDFKTYLRKYVDGARAKGATAVLVTPPPRNSAYCTGGNGTGAHAQAMRELGASEKVAVADLNQKTVDHLKAICPAPTPEDFFLLRADGTVDGTHFQENGARIMAGFVAAEVQRLGLPLSRYLR